MVQMEKLVHVTMSDIGRRVQNKMHVEIRGYLHVCSIHLPIVESSLILKNKNIGTHK